ncbi:hypothetical protein ACH4UT_31785 [Streptomyces sp. NPDC020799]|uniref:hypothetical protein n=1 Tax=Streptomyces sp. NPDC020799 TaxID=3365091 RepID=UPI0037AEC34E
MSEYQYYEFLAVDRPLDPRQLGEVRAASTQARITPASFVNTYQWGDLKADPRRMMERYHDAHLYVANWGTRRLMLKLPAALLPLTTASPYAAGDNTAVHLHGNHVILDWRSEDEDGMEEDFDDGSGHLAALIGIRAELAAGDLRPLYLGWLATLPGLDNPGTVLEPPVPAGLGSLTGPQQALAAFLLTDPHLLHTASHTSHPESATDDRQLAKWIAALPTAGKDALLLRLAREAATRPGAGLLHGYRQYGPPAAPAEPRTAAALLHAAHASRSMQDRTATGEDGTEDTR